MLLSNPFPGAFGLDIGDLSIKLMRMRVKRHWRKSKTFHVDIIRSVRLPPGLIVNGEIQQPELVRKKILYLIGKEGNQKLIRAPWVVASLPEPQTFLKLIDINAPAKEILPDDIIFQAKKHLPFELDSAYLDWQIIPSQTSGATESTAVLLAAVPKIISDSYIYLLEACELVPLALEVEALSISRALITEDKDYTGEARALLDVGATRSSLIIYDHGSVQVSTTLPFSGELITTALAQGLKLEYVEAEKLKLKNGLCYDAERPLYLNILNDLVKILVVDIKKAIVFYKEHFHDANPVTHITMCGGTSLLKNFSTVISQKLGVAAQPGNAWKNARPGILSEEDKQRGLALANVIGLALRAAEYDFS